jgi:BON domain
VAKKIVAPVEEVKERLTGLSSIWSSRRTSKSAELRRTARRFLPAVPAGAALLALAYFANPRQGRRRRKMALQRMAGGARHRARAGRRATRHVASEARGAAQRALHPQSRQSPPADDITLAHKVETEIFRPADAPKGTVNVNAVEGVVFLRGIAQTPEQIRELERKVQAIPGVKAVENLLHLPGTPAPHDSSRGHARA